MSLSILNCHNGGLQMTQLSPLMWTLTSLMFSATLLILMSSLWWKSLPTFKNPNQKKSPMTFKKWKW